jgi:predicted amidophosphoribosyltransferase
MLIILVMGLVCIGVPIAILVVVFGAARRSHSSMPESPPCPQCGTHVVPGAKFCHQCGATLGPSAPPQGQGTTQQ